MERNVMEHTSALRGDERNKLQTDWNDFKCLCWHFKKTEKYHLKNPSS